MQILTLSSILQISLVLSLLAAIPSITKAQTKANIKERKQLLKEAIDTLKQNGIEEGKRQLQYVIRGGLLNPKLIEKNRVIQQKLKPKNRNELIYKAQLHRDKFLKRENKDMVTLMDTLLERDQKYRMAAYDCIGDEFSNKPKRDSCTQLYKVHVKKMDSLNLMVLDSIVAEYGWVNESWAGGSDAAWAIIWHNGLEVKRKYFPLIKAAYLEGEFSASEFYSMEDNLLLNDCKNQIHNTISC